MMKLLVRMKYTQRKFFRRNIIPQHQIQLVHISVPAGNRGDGIMRFSLRPGKTNAASSVYSLQAASTFSPSSISRSGFPDLVQHRHGPVYYSRLHILKIFDFKNIFRSALFAMANV